MITAELLERLDGVRPRGTNCWSTLCPAHKDRSPSLGVTEGDKGILLKCWAGCSLEAICAALGIKQDSLFFDAPCASPQERRLAKFRRDCERKLCEAERRRRGELIDAVKLAEQHIAFRAGIDISDWSDAQLDRELNLLGDAYQLMEHDPYATR